jgi:hypothetical protein
MALAGRGAIIIWNDIAPEGRAEFYDWHLNEHIPERLGVPGFLRGARYIALTGETKPEFLTLYETAGPSVATSAAYLARLNAPTEWTKRATAHFRKTSRALTEVVQSDGAGSGGVMATWRFDETVAGAAAVTRVRSAWGEIAKLARQPRISGVHLCLTNTAASAAKTAESRDRKDILTAPIGAVLIEGCDEAAVRAAATELTVCAALNRSDATMGLYRLEHALCNFAR